MKTLGPSIKVQTTTKTTTTMNTTETTIDDASKTSESRAESTNAFQLPRANPQSAYLHDGGNDFNETSYSPRATTSRQHGRHQMYRWPTINRWCSTQHFDWHLNCITITNVIFPAEMLVKEIILLSSYFPSFECVYMNLVFLILLVIQ